MDFRAVLIFLYLIIAQAACGLVRRETKTGAVNATIQLIRKEIRTALDHLAVPGLLPNASCAPLNFTELRCAEQEPPASWHLRSFGCLLLEMSELTPELSPQLRTTSQYIRDVARLSSAPSAGRDCSQACSLPRFEQDMDSYVYVRCLLQLLDQHLATI